MKKETILAEIGSLQKGDVLEIRMVRVRTREYEHNRFKPFSEKIYIGDNDPDVKKWGKSYDKGWYYYTDTKDYRMVVVSNSTSKEQVVLRKYNSRNRPPNTEIYDYKLFLKAEYFIVGKRKSFFGIPYIKHNK